MSPLPRLVRTRAELAQASAALLQAAYTAQERAGAWGRVSQALVPTMGGLHDGHAALAEAARAANDVVVVSIFVNPLQFGDPADLARYPRTLDADLALLAECGVDLVFAPEAAEMYPDGEPLVRISSGRLGERFEGASRPGHFDGALTVVAKLLHCAAPGAHADYRAYFGQKDAQQLALVRRMVADLNFPVEIIAVPTVRAADGLALSSRNRFLSAPQREAALVLSRALRLLQERAAARQPLDLDDARKLVDSQKLLSLDYFEVVDPATLEPLAENCRHTPFRGEALALIAGQVGQVRLIDNMPLSS